jgi:hypothetical protein
MADIERWRDSAFVVILPWQLYGPKPQPVAHVEAPHDRTLCGIRTVTSRDQCWRPRTVMVHVDIARLFARPCKSCRTVL